MQTFVGNTPTITLQTGVDVSGYTTWLIHYRKPNGITGCWTATVCPADDECITYDSGPTDIDVAGDWTLQAYVEGAAGVNHHGLWVTFKVHDPLLETCTTLAPTTAAP